MPLWTYYAAVMVSAAVEVSATLLLVKSNGFSKLRYSVFSLFLVGVAFTFLAYAVRRLDLAVTYAMWGSFGILGTSLGGWIFYRQQMRASAWLGIALLIGGVLLMNF